MDQTTKELFQRAVAALQSGDRAMARQLFLQVTVFSPEYQPTWLWLSDTVDSRDQQRSYLQRCIDFDPYSRSGQLAQKKLQRLVPAAAGASPALAGTTRDPYGTLQPVGAVDDPAKQSAVWQVFGWIVGGLAMLGVFALVGWVVLSSTIFNNPAEQTAEQPATGIAPIGGDNAAVPAPEPGVGVTNPITTEVTNPTTTTPVSETEAAVEPQPAQPISPANTPSYPAPGTGGQQGAQGSYPAPGTGGQPVAPAPVSQVPGGPPEVTGDLPPLAAADVAAYPTPIEPAQVTTSGVGMPREQWEQQQGSGELVAGSSDYTFAEGPYIVRFRNASVWRLEHQIGQSGAVSFEEARLQAQQRMPQDSQYVDQYTEDDGSVVEVYRSAWLATRLPAWFSAEPGRINVRYQLSGENVESYRITTGIDL